MIGETGFEDVRSPATGRTVSESGSGEVSRSQAYRLIERGVVPFQVFAGVRYIRGEDIAAFARHRQRID